MGLGEANRKYLESFVGVPFVHLETLDGYGASQVFPIAHVCEPAVATDPPDAQEPLSESI